MENLPAERRTDIQALISQGIEKGLDVESMRALLDMAIQMEDRYAKAQFNAAMVKFQAECPIIPKKKEVRDNNNMIAYRYAPLDVIMQTIQPLLHECQLHVTSDTTTDFHLETVTAIVRVEHVLGHVELKQYSLPFLEPNRMMKKHNCAEGALTIAIRRCISNALGIYTTDDDTNGEPEVRKEERLKVDAVTLLRIRELIPPTNYTEESICRSLKIGTLHELSLKQAQGLEQRLLKTIQIKQNDDIPF